MDVKDVLPIADQMVSMKSDVTWMVIGMGVLFVLALIGEQVRQKALNRKRIRMEWETIEAMAAEKELPQAGWNRLKQCIARWLPEYPLRAMTSRFDFDHCVDSEMKALLVSGAHAEYETAGEELHDVRRHLGLDHIPYGQRIYTTRELVGGIPAWIALTSVSKPRWYAMRIHSVDEAYLTLHAIEGQEVPDLAPGVEVRIRLWREDDARYMFKTKLERKLDMPDRWQFHHTTELDRVQSRDFFRIRFDHTVEVAVLERPKDGQTTALVTAPPIDAVHGRLTSLSGGGFALLATHPIADRAFIRVNLDLPNMEPILAVARVVGTTMQANGRCLVRATFIGLEDEHRDKIVRFVTIQQQLHSEANFVEPLA